jgi:hypothetical protein
VLPALRTGWRANLHDLGVAYSGVLDLLGIDTGMGVKAKNPLGVSFSLSACSSLARAVGPGHEGTALALTGVLGAASIGVAWLLYRRARVPLLAWPSRGLERSAWASYTAVEWAGLLVVALVFSPQTNSRHLVLLTVPAACAGALLFSSRSVRWFALASLGVLLLGITFPPGSAETHALVKLWRESGAEAGCVLVSYALLLHAALQHGRGRCAGAGELESDPLGAGMAASPAVA